MHNLLTLGYSGILFFKNWLPDSLNYIETATLKFIEEVDYVDDFEMENILNDEKLLRSLRKGSTDAAKKRGRFI